MIINKKSFKIGIIFLFMVSVITPMSHGYNVRITNEVYKIFDCFSCQQEINNNMVKIFNSSTHDYNIKSESFNKETSCFYSHKITDIITPFNIANMINEYVYFIITCRTNGFGLGRHVYITIWCENEIYDDWLSEDLIPPDTNGINTYPFKITKVLDKTCLNFTAETGHLFFGIRIRDDKAKFSIPIGKTNAVPDQICTMIATTTYNEMVKNSSCPHFQEITTGISGQIHSIDYKSPLPIAGCGEYCMMNIIIMKWFENWQEIPWDKDVFKQYFLGEVTVAWLCAEWPLPIWWEADFSNLNIMFNKGERFVVFFEGEVWSINCWNQGVKCLSFSNSPPEAYPDDLGKTGFWSYSLPGWIDRTSRADLPFRLWIKIPEGNNPPKTPNGPYGPTEGITGIEYQYLVNTSDPDGDEIYYLFDWGDGTNSGWIGSFESNEKMICSHSWLKLGIFKVKVKARDVYNAESDWAYLQVTIPRNKVTNILSFRFLEQFPILQKIIHKLKN